VTQELKWNTKHRNGEEVSLAYSSVLSLLIQLKAWLLPISLTLVAVLHWGQELNIARTLFLYTVITIVYMVTQEILKQVAKSNNFQIITL
jgi:hypothetical protein